jgi:citrate lyase subunit beta / citryl-CoA lyase
MPARRRACLSVPGSSDKMVAKARDLDVDEIILDLEDAVAPADKEAARARVVAAVSEPGWRCGQIAVRVNAPGTTWGPDDVAALRGLDGVASVIVPKAEDPKDVAAIDLPMQVLIESARGLANVNEIGQVPRVVSLVLGYADLAASLGRSAALDLDLWAPVQHQVLLAARAGGVQAIDGPWLGTADDEPFRRAAERAAALGFDGKWAIHPQQVAFLTDCFTPSDEEVQWARRVLEALDQADEGAVALDGQMLDEAVAVAARRVLERAG